MQIRHATLTTESPTGAGGTVGATEWDEAHEVIGFYNRNLIFGAIGGGSSLTVIGTAALASTVSATGTGAGAPAGTSSRSRYTSAATANALACASAAVGQYLPPLVNYGSQAISVSASLDFYDADYGTGATGARLGFGMIRTAANMFGGDDGTTGDNASQGIWFSYSTNRGGNWQIVIRKDTSTVTLVDTGVAFTPGVWNFEFVFNENSASFDWSIRKLGGSYTQGTYTETGSNFPSNRATSYVWCAGLSTLTTTARNVGIINVSIHRLEPA